MDERDDDLSALIKTKATRPSSDAWSLKLHMIVLLC